jgi:hypothetical protein
MPRAGAAAAVAAAASAAAASAAAPPSPPSLVGSWPSYIGLLPALQLPHAPIVGNGHLGAIFDSRSAPTAAFTAANGTGPGGTNALDVWLSTTSFWSCTGCGGVDPDHDVPACCSTAALGGVSLRLAPTFPPTAPLPGFAATQAVADGTVATAWRTPAGGNVTTATRVHPSLDVVVTNVSWAPAPGGGDPPALTLDVSTWALGDGAIPGSWNTGTPAAWQVGCVGGCGGGGGGGGGGAPPVVFVSRNASTVDAAVMPVAAALATTVALGPGATVVSAAVTAGPTAGGTGHPFEVTIRVSIPAGSWAAAASAEAETRGPGLADPVPAAVAAVSAPAAAPAAVASASTAWWAAFWAKSSVSLPSRPGVEAYWVGAQYALASSSSTSSAVVAPGLYGPFVTADGPNWHGEDVPPVWM